MSHYRQNGKIILSTGTVPFYADKVNNLDVQLQNQMKKKMVLWFCHILAQSCFSNKKINYAYFLNLKKL